LHCIVLTGVQFKDVVISLLLNCNYPYNSKNETFKKLCWYWVMQILACDIVT